MESVPYSIEIEPEVRHWLEGIPAHHYVIAEHEVDRLAENATTLGEPYTRHLTGKVRELRFELDGNAQRITYWVASSRHIVLLTVFHKSRMRETAEVARAHALQMECEAHHQLDPANADYSRSVHEEPR